MLLGIDADYFLSCPIYVSLNFIMISDVVILQHTKYSHEYILSLVEIHPTITFAYLFQKAHLHLQQQNIRHNIILQHNHQQEVVSHHDGTVVNVQYDAPPALPPRVLNAVIFSPLPTLTSAEKPQGRVYGYYSVLFCLH